MPSRYRLPLTILFLVLLIIFTAVIVKNIDKKQFYQPKAKTGSAPAELKPTGLYSLTGWSETPDPAIWANSAVTGVVIRAYWRDLNPGPDQYNWAYLDEQFSRAQSHAKKIRLAIAPGFYSPAWVLSQVQTVKFEVPQGPLKGAGPQPLPLPWDDTYLNLWFKFIDALAERYAGRPQFSYISVTGPNSHNGEVNLPNQKTDGAQWIRLADNSASKLQTRLEQAYYRTIDHFNQAFGSRGKYFTIALITNSFPTTGDQQAEWEYKNNLVGYGASHYPNSFGIQTNGLDGRDLCPKKSDFPRHWSFIRDYSDRLLTGFQTEAVANLYDCRRVPEVSILQRALDNAADFKADFVELYQSEFLDPAKTSFLNRSQQSF